MTNSQISKLIKKVLLEQVGGTVIKFGMTDKGGSTKIRDLQKALKIKSPKTGGLISTGFFGGLTNAELLSKVPDLYNGKNDVIDDIKYNQILSKLKSQPETVVPKKKKPQQSNDVISSNNVISSINYNNLLRNFPKDSLASDIFPIIFPTAYKQFPKSFGNLCATRLSLALNNMGIRPPSQFETEKDLNWKGVTYKKGLPITVRAKDTPNYLKSKFGEPSLIMNNTLENTNKYLYGKKGIFVLTNVPGWTATGHADIFSSYFNGLNGEKNFSCGKDCHFGEGGKMQVWFIK
jgi:hypothetical protein